MQLASVADGHNIMTVFISGNNPESRCSKLLELTRDLHEGVVLNEPLL
jgi:hypothetical protein